MYRTAMHTGQQKKRTNPKKSAFKHRPTKQPRTGPVILAYVRVWFLPKGYLAALSVAVRGYSGPQSKIRVGNTAEPSLEVLSTC